jgi:hypothetical protein
VGHVTCTGHNKCLENLGLKTLGRDDLECVAVSRKIILKRFL